MKISTINTLRLSRMHEPERQWITAKYRTVKADCAIVVIETDEGLRGVGEASAYGNPTLIREWVDWLAPDLIGTDPLDLEIAPHPDGLGRPHDTAVAGIDCALWDLRGKIQGRRVCNLLVEHGLTGADGATSPPGKVRLYASSGCRYDWRTDPEQLFREAESYIADGYTAMKFRMGTDWSWDGITVDRFLDHVRALVDVVNGRMELMLDGNCRLTEEQALTIAKELDSLGFRWFEEPVPWRDPDAYARLAASVEMPITGGESFATTSLFRPFLDSGGYDIVQPDAGLSGITETARMASTARRFGAKFCPHSWHNGLMMMANAHLVAAQPEPQLLERCMIQGPLQFGILSEPPTIEDGWLLLPDVPGLGVEIAEDLEETFPFIEGQYNVEVVR